MSYRHYLYYVWIEAQADGISVPTNRPLHRYTMKDLPGQFFSQVLPMSKAAFASTRAFIDSARASWGFPACNWIDPDDEKPISAEKITQIRRAVPLAYSPTALDMMPCLGPYASFYGVYKKTTVWEPYPAYGFTTEKTLGSGSTTNAEYDAKAIGKAPEIPQLGGAGRGIIGIWISYINMFPWISYINMFPNKGAVVCKVGILESEVDLEQSMAQDIYDDWDNRALADIVVGDSDSPTTDNLEVGGIDAPEAYESGCLFGIETEQYGYAYIPSQNHDPGLYQIPWITIILDDLGDDDIVEEEEDDD